MKMPTIKKRINSFLIGEEGKISKESILKFGAIISIAAIAGSLETKQVVAGHTNTISHESHGNDLGLGYEAQVATATHAHEITSTHSNSHSNHSEGGWC